MKLQQFDLNLLKAFVVLMDERSVSKAAVHLSVSQPAMSATLFRLRESIGDPLFIRTQRGIVPTNRAIALYPIIKQCLQHIENALQPDLFNPLESEKVITIACSDYIMQAVIMPLLPKLRYQAPKMKVSVINLNQQTIQHQLEQGIVDLFFSTPDFQAADIDAKNLYQEHYVCAVSLTHPLAQQSQLSLQQFCQQEQVIVSCQSGRFNHQIDEKLAQLGLVRNAHFTFQNFLIVPDLLAQDLLVVVPQKLVENRPNIRCIPLPIEIQGFTNTLFWHERTHRDLSLQWLRTLIIAHCQG